jgi:DDE superfamily endonuclease
MALSGHARPDRSACPGSVLVSRRTGSSLLSRLDCAPQPLRLVGGAALAPRPRRSGHAGSLQPRLAPDANCTPPAAPPYSRNTPPALTARARCDAPAARHHHARAEGSSLQLDLSVRCDLSGAGCGQRGGAATVNIDAMNHHLAAISTSVSADAIMPDNVVLLKLPPYAPELNPVENIWAYLRANGLAHQVWETYAAIEDACFNAWNRLTRFPTSFAPSEPDWAEVRI